MTGGSFSLSLIGRGDESIHTIFNFDNNRKDNKKKMVKLGLKNDGLAGFEPRENLGQIRSCSFQQRSKRGLNIIILLN